MTISNNIKREIYAEIYAHIDKPQISMIIGARQVGKTTIMRQLQKDLSNLGHKTLFLNLDIEDHQMYFVSQNNLINKIKLEFGDDKGYVFVDEIQKKTDAGVFLKGVYDMDLGYKFIISGSGSLELKEKIHESLAGRKRVFEMMSVSFLEFVNYKTNYKYSDRIYEFIKIEQNILDNLFWEYINFGGYPQVVLATDIGEKTKIIDEIYKSYILKDISYLMNIDKVDKYELLMKVLATQSGQIIKYSELAKQVGVSETTIKNYLYYAINTFFVKLSHPFHQNLQKEIIKSPILYYNDLGVRNYNLGLFGHISPHQNIGFLFQNFIYNILYQKYIWTNTSIKFWQTVDGGEVDVILDSPDTIIPIEIKYVKYQKPEINKSITNFISKYKPKEFWIINLSLETDIYIGNTRVIFKPFYQLFAK